MYEIEFISATTEYDYEIDAVKGTIIERKAEKRKIQSQEQSKPSASYIGVDKAKNTALSHAGLQEKEVLFTKAKLENDDGQSVYEIEFRKGNTEYDYTIDAFKGSILEWDKDTDHDD
ncbi:PepSY domain-containing protein [[Clostridium] innocuum]|nr:PepSY domain-containing protein [[Clostridium] innocuum]